MSAFIVSREDIDVLVAAIRNTTDLTPDELGRLLWSANLASLIHRYPGDGDGERPGPRSFRDSDVDTYTFTAPAAEYTTDGAVLKFAQCYEYQTEEYPGWGFSDAHALIAPLIAALKAGGAERTAEYRNTPWGL